MLRSLYNQSKAQLKQSANSCRPLCLVSKKIEYPYYGFAEFNEILPESINLADMYENVHNYY